MQTKANKSYRKQKTIRDKYLDECEKEGIKILEEMEAEALDADNFSGPGVAAMDTIRNKIKNK